MKWGRQLQNAGVGAMAVIGAIVLTPPPASASGIGFSTIISNAAGINSATYASDSTFTNIAPGYNTVFADPGASATTTPATMPLGLNDGAIQLTASGGSFANVSGGLATGALHTQVNAAGANDIAVAEGTLSDGLTFHVAGGGTALIDVTLSLDGSYSGDWYTQSVTLGFGSGALSWQAFDNGPVGFGPNAFGWVSSSLPQDALNGFTFTAVLLVHDGDADTFTLNDTLECRYATSCDFSNTLQANLILPAGVTFTSASGEFLSANATTPPVVPEPGTVTLLASGLAALVLARRKPSARA